MLLIRYSLHRVQLDIFGDLQSPFAYVLDLLVCFVVGVDAVYVEQLWIELEHEPKDFGVGNIVKKIVLVEEEDVDFLALNVHVLDRLVSERAERNKGKGFCQVLNQLVDSAKDMCVVFK